MNKADYAYLVWSYLRLMSLKDREEALVALWRDNFVDENDEWKWEIGDI
jgi:hypothetical protein